LRIYLDNLEKQPKHYKIFAYIFLHAIKIITWITEFVCQAFNLLIINTNRKEIDMKSLVKLTVFVTAMAFMLVAAAGLNNTAQCGDHPTSEHPKAEAPKADHPKTEHPKAEQPKAEHPEVDKHSTIEHPKAEKPKTEKPKTEHPKAEHPE